LAYRLVPPPQPFLGTVGCLEAQGFLSSLSLGASHEGINRRLEEKASVSSYRLVLLAGVCL
jgi:hypothetical protein